MHTTMMRREAPAMGSCRLTMVLADAPPGGEVTASARGEPLRLLVAPSSPSSKLCSLSSAAHEGRSQCLFTYRCCLAVRRVCAVEHAFQKDIIKDGFKVCVGMMDFYQELQLHSSVATWAGKVLEGVMGFWGAQLLCRHHCQPPKIKKH